MNKAGIEPTSAGFPRTCLTTALPLCYLFKRNLYSALPFISAIRPDDTLPNTWFHSYAISELISDVLIGGDGVGSGTWTHTGLLPTDFKSVLSADSNIPTYGTAGRTRTLNIRSRNPLFYPNWITAAYIGAGGGTWTRTSRRHKILSLACLPIPPRQHIYSARPLSKQLAVRFSRFHRLKERI